MHLIKIGDRVVGATSEPITPESLKEFQEQHQIAQQMIDEGLTMVKKEVNPDGTIFEAESRTPLVPVTNNIIWENPRITPAQPTNPSK